MTITRLLVALLAIFAMAPTVGAQDPVRNLRDVVGMNLGNGWREMDQRGYTRVRTDGEYTYFRESRSNRCVIMHADRGRVASVVYTDDFDCDRGSSNSSSYGGGGGDVRELRDLQGTRGSDGEYQMKQRGYRLDHVDKSTSGISQYWSKGRDCVQVEMYDGRYERISSSPRRNCSSSGPSSGGGRPNYGSPDYPRVNVDTAGRGNYDGPGFSEPGVDRGHVDTSGSRIMVGLSNKRGFRMSLYGRITREVGDREYRFEINDSDDGRASGSGVFRLNRDQNEVEMIEFSGRISGRSISGRFNRS